MKKKMLKFFAFIIAAVMVLSVCSCTVSEANGAATTLEETTTVKTTETGNETVTESVTENQTTSPSESETTQNEGDETTGAEESTTAIDESVIIGNNLFYLQYTEQDYNDYLKQLADISEAVKAEKLSDSEFMELFNEMDNTGYAKIESIYLLSLVRARTLVNEEKYADELTDFSKKYNDSMQIKNKLNREIYDSKYRDVFFEGWSEKQITVALKEADNSSEEYADLLVQSDEFKSKYYEISNSENFLQLSAELYLEAIEVNNKLAKSVGYDNYMDYAYELDYLRDYTPEDVDKISEYVKTYIVPIVDTSVQKYHEYEDLLTEDEIDYVLSIVGCDFSDMNIKEIFGESAVTTKASETFEDYLKAMGGNMYEIYSEMWSDGNYIIGTDYDCSDASACTVYLRSEGKGLVYFGPGTDTLSTLAHEFGHYYSAMKSGHADMPMDLAEVESQTNEWLFTYYMSNVLSENQYNYYRYYCLTYDLLTLIRCLTVDRFEYAVYTSDKELKAEDLDNIMKDVMIEMGVYDTMAKYNSNPLAYWHYVVIDNPGYYVSYSISLIPTLSIFATSEQNFASAAEIYQSITEVGKHDTFVGTLENSGVGSPFEAEIYQNIASLVNTDSKK